jgi:hypothetical protein
MFMLVWHRLGMIPILRLPLTPWCVVWDPSLITCNDIVQEFIAMSAVTFQKWQSNTHALLLASYVSIIGTLLTHTSTNWRWISAKQFFFFAFKNCNFMAFGSTPLSILCRPVDWTCSASSYIPQLFSYIWDLTSWYVLFTSGWTILRFLWRWLWRMASSGMLRHVALVRTDVSEDLSSSFIRVTRIGELGTTLAVTSNRHMPQRNTIGSYQSHMA